MTCLQFAIIHHFKFVGDEKTRPFFSVPGDTIALCVPYEAADQLTTPFQTF